MKKQLFVPLVMLAAASLSTGAQAVDACSHSFFSIRPPFQSSMPEKITLFRDRALVREDGWGGAFQIVPFGGKTTNSKRLASFFTPNCSDTLIFAESSAVGGPDTVFPDFRDVNARHFGIATTGDNFKSTVKFRPRQSFVGVGFTWKQYLARRCDCDRRWWLEISFPVEHVRNDMHLTESIITQGTIALSAGASNITQAFTGDFPAVSDIGTPTTPSFVVTGSGWNFGRIDGSRKKTGVADIEFKIGYDYLNSECCHLGGYVGAVFPTGNKPKGVYVFEPIIGNNRHFGIMWGGYFGGIIWENCDKRLSLEIETNYRYLFRNTQTRSFDLRGKPWSRYMLVYPTAGDAASQIAQEGINIFTRRVHVKPRFSKDINTGLVFDWCHFQAEIGYNFWARQCEQVKLKDPWIVGPALAALTLVDGLDANSINRAIIIKENFTGAATAYTTALAIHETDLDLNSAAHPCAITNTIYGALGYHWDDWCWPVFVGVGGSYEFSKVNTGINRWTVWGKIGVSI